MEKKEKYDEKGNEELKYGGQENADSASLGT